MSEGIDFELIHANDNILEKSNKGVLLFHGLTGSPFEMKKYGNFLFKNGYNVFCYSFPGHGNRLHEIQTIKWTDWCEFAQEKYNYLKKRYSELYVSGLCLGAAIAIYLGENNPDIKAIVSLSTTLFLDGASMPWYKLFMPLGLHTILRYYYTFPEDNSLGIKNESTRQKLAKIMTKTTVGMDNYPLSCVNELLKLSMHVRKNLKKLRTPILLIHSKYDNLTSPKSAHVVYENVSSERKEYIELDNSYHMVLYDNEKAFVMESALEFLNEYGSCEVERELKTL